MDGSVTRRYQISEQTLYQQRDEFGKTMVVLKCPALAGNGGASKVCTRHSCLRSACHQRSR